MKKKLVVLLAVVCVLCMAQSAFAWKIASFRTWFAKDKNGKNVTKYEMVIDDRNWEVAGRRLYYVFYDNKRRPIGTYPLISWFGGRSRYEGTNISGQAKLEDGVGNLGGTLSVKYSKGRYTIRSESDGHLNIDRVSIIGVE